MRQSQKQFQTVKNSGSSQLYQSMNFPIRLPMANPYGQQPLRHSYQNPSTMYSNNVPSSRSPMHSASKASHGNVHHTANLDNRFGDTSSQYAFRGSPATGVQSVIGTASAPQRGLLGESLAVADFGRALQQHARAGHPQRSANVAKDQFGNAIPRRNQNFIAGLTHTEGNQSVAALSQGDVASLQGREELREQYQYKRQLHSNMTQRVLNQKQEQEGKSRASDLEPRGPSPATTLPQQRGLKLEAGGPWSTVPHPNQTPSAANAVQSSPFGVITSSPQPLAGKQHRMISRSEKLTEDPPMSQR